LYLWLDDFSDEIFMPKSDGDIDNGEMDEVEKELEEFKRFVMNLIYNEG
jgi:hypothetical protein